MNKKKFIIGFGSEKIKKRLFLWLIMILISALLGLYIDLFFIEIWIPVYIRIVGLIGFYISMKLLKFSGRMLKELGEPSEWGWTTKLVTTGIYKCVRHPHHFGIGLSITSIGLLIGGISTFTLMTITIWISIILFLIMIEEKELLEKFGDEYIRYKKDTPMLLPKIRCLIRELF